MDGGDVWWADLPRPVGRRPVLILTRSAAVAVRNQVVVAQVTRTTHGLPCEVELTQAEGMPHDSFANCDVLLTVPKSRLTRRIAVVTQAKMIDVNNALKFAMDIP
jgi:mRNA interferase MazF